MNYPGFIFAIALYGSSMMVYASDASHHHDVAEYLKVENIIKISQIESHDILSVVDWELATRVEILFDDDFYEPSELALEAGQAYILEVKNIGEKQHDISGEQFFLNMVVKQVRHRDLTVSAYHIESIHIRAGEEMEIWLVPQNAGEFPFICTLPGHMHDGMEGLLTVKPR